MIESINATAIGQRKQLLSSYSRKRYCFLFQLCEKGQGSNESEVNFVENLGSVLNNYINLISEAANMTITTINPQSIASSKP